MKKFALLFAAGLLLGGAVFAKEENGALGIGILTEQTEKSFGTGNIRGSLFLDVGYQLTGPLYYGFEFQGDVKQMSKASFQITSTDVTYVKFSETESAIFFRTEEYNTNYTLWDLDFSPRGYLSFDLGDKIQILGFAGLNYNWQTLDFEVSKKDKTTGFMWGNTEVAAGDTYKETTNVGDGYWSLVAGFRVSVGAFYGEYTRFLDDTTTQVSWNKYSKNRIGLGINLRF